MATGKYDLRKNTTTGYWEMFETEHGTVNNHPAIRQQMDSLNASIRAEARRNSPGQVDRVFAAAAAMDEEPPADS